MVFLSTLPISKMGAGYGDTSEIINVDTLALIHIGCNHGTRSLQVVMCFGGYDTAGLCHMVPENVLTPGQMNLTHRVKGEDAIWEDCLLDAKGNPVRVPTEAVLAKILITHGQLAKMINGHWILKSVEL